MWLAGLLSLRAKISEKMVPEISFQTMNTKITQNQSTTGNAQIKCQSMHLHVKLKINLQV